MNALMYVMVNGVQWRDLPKDFPPFTTVYYYFEKLRDNGSVEDFLILFASLVRVNLGRMEMPTCVVTDTLSAKNYLSGRPKGYDAGKKVKGRKRIVIADAATRTPLTVAVVTADVQDRDLAADALLKLGDLLTVLAENLGLGFDLKLEDVFQSEVSPPADDTGAGKPNEGVRKVEAALGDRGFQGSEQEIARSAKGLPPIK